MSTLGMYGNMYPCRGARGCNWAVTAGAAHPWAAFCGPRAPRSSFRASRWRLPPAWRPGPTAGRPPAGPSAPAHACTSTHSSQQVLFTGTAPYFHSIQHCSLALMRMHASTTGPSKCGTHLEKSSGNHVVQNMCRTQMAPIEDACIATETERSSHWACPGLLVCKLLLADIWERGARQ